MNATHALVTQALLVVGTTPKDKATLARSAFELAHRARRLLELAAATASRDRWRELVKPEGRINDNDAQFALDCSLASIKYPVVGEAKVYAALLDAVDTAKLVSDALYQRWLETQRTEKPAPDPQGVRRIGGPIAEGCQWPSCARSDDISSSG